MKMRLAILTLAALCLSAAPAMADMYGMLDVSYESLIRGTSVLKLTHTGGTPNVEYAIGLHSLNAGQLDTTQPPADTALPGESFLTEGILQAFCIDLAQGFPIPTAITPSYEYGAYSLDEAPVPGNPMGDDKAKYIAQLLNTSVYGTSAQATAVQIAIWEIIYDPIGSWDTASGQGNFYLDTTNHPYGEDTIATAANTLLSGLAQANSFGQYTAIIADFKDGQDFVIVPVPAAMLLGLLGLGTAGLRLRKRS